MSFTVAVVNGSSLEILQETLDFVELLLDCFNGVRLLGRPLEITVFRVVGPEFAIAVLAILAEFTALRAGMVTSSGRFGVRSFTTMLGIRIYFSGVLAFLGRRLFSFLFPLGVLEHSDVVLKLVAHHGIQEVIIVHVLPICFKAVVDVSLVVWWECVVDRVSNFLIRNLERFLLRISGIVAFLRGRWW